MAQSPADNVGVLLNYRKILARNVAGLMKTTPALSSGGKLARKCSTDARKIGASTIRHMLNEDGPQARLDTIVAVADAFKIAPWMLLMPDFDPKSRNLREPPSPEVIELAQRIAGLTPARLELLLDIFRGYGAPDQLAFSQSPTVQQPKPRYGKK